MTQIEPEGSAPESSGLSRAVLDWVVRESAPHAAIVGVHGLREGGAPWLIVLDDGGAPREVVLRPGDAASLRLEERAATAAATAGIPVPRVLAVHESDDSSRLLMERAPGSSRIPHNPTTGRLRALGALAADIHRVDPGDSDLPHRDRPIPLVDFAGLRLQQPPRELLNEAEERIAAQHVDDVVGFVHGDLWQGNTLWADGTLSAVLDWDCAGLGPAGVDLGSVRCDAAVCFGPSAADDVLAGWEDAAGRPATSVAYWDLVAALSTPPDMGWFVEAMADQGRSDLDRSLLIERRDGFIAGALRRLGD